jgi:dTDP-glucose 4,6-dehydratase
MLVSDDAVILVTGGWGFMGSAFIRFLLLSCPEFSGKIVNYDLLTYAANEQSVAAVKDSKRYHFIQGDVCDGKLLEKVVLDHEVSVIVHFAAETHVDRSIEDPAPFFDTNIRGTFTILELLKKYPEIHLHQISTDEVYGSLGDSNCFYEYSPFRPNSPYAASKAAADLLIRSYVQTYGIATTVSHSCNNYGPYQFPEKFIPVVITKAQKKEPIPVYGKGRNIRSWLFVEDHAKAVYAILKHGKKGQHYNIGGTEKSNLDLLQLLLEQIAKQTSQPLDHLTSLITFVQDRKGHDFRYALSMQKLKEHTGFMSEVSLEEGIEKTIKWYTKQKHKV